MGQKFDKWSEKNIVDPFVRPAEKLIESTGKHLWHNKGKSFFIILH